MGIETILIVVGIVIVVAIVVAATKSKRKIENEPTTPPAKGTVRPPSETDHP
jgi:FtsZ-interacting cell division protein ZipA